MSTHTTSHKYYAAIFVPGLYSIQGISNSSSLPDVTVYRESLENLMRGKNSAFAKLQAGRRFNHYALRHASDKVDYYDRAGRRLTEGGGPEIQGQTMSTLPLSCSRPAMLKRAAWLVPNPTVCGSFEAHPGQSAADRSNFYTMVDQLLNLAKTDRDREHLYMLSSHIPCAVSLLVADLANATEAAQGVFLDFFQRLRQGWPLQEHHHRTELARTLAGCRFAQLCAWLRELRVVTHPQEDPQRLEFLLCAIPAKLRLALAAALVGEAYPRFILSSGDAESLAPGVVASLAPTLGPRVAQLLAEPMLKI